GGSQKYMGYIFPIFMAVFLYSFPAGLWLYYLLTTLFQVGQQYFVNWEMAKEGTITSMSAAPAEGILDDGETDDGEDQSAD
ncbi:YidC/Oxa1 family membrane protein insertase, partial [Candidatus Bipolaricaulota bacterium]|nr:YidC/Oxa1 family membrane protein insertase [Candidatus Bipolaricaulota bacterium]